MVASRRSLRRGRTPRRDIDRQHLGDQGQDRRTGTGLTRTSAPDEGSPAGLAFGELRVASCEAASGIGANPALTGLRVRRQLADPLVDPDVDGVARLLADGLPQRRLDREPV